MPESGAAPLSCGRCGDTGAVGITAADLAVLGDPAQIEGGGGAFGGGGLGAFGLWIARRWASRAVAGIALCPTCRVADEPEGVSFRLPKALAVAGFCFGFLLVGLPLSLVLYAVSYLTLNRRLRTLRGRPTMAGLRRALDAAGTLAVAVAANLLIALVLAAVVIYMVYFRR